MKKNISILAPILIAGIFLAGTASAAVIGVPGDYPTVQQAIDAASSGDTVSVAAGTYAPSTNGESFPVNMKNGVRLIGAGAEVCTLDAEGTNRVIFCNSISDTATRIEGFRITNGQATNGGGVHCQNASVIITGNLVTGNSANRGSGIGCWWGAPTITGNVITGNIGGWAGGGIQCHVCSAVITNNLITENQADLGAGINCYRCSPVITNNVISGNSGRIGGGIWCEHSSAPITNNIVTSNSAGQYGGGIWCSSSSLAINYDDVWGNSPDDYVNCGPGTGCISADPLFVAPGFDNYHLQPTSPCIDAGDNDAPGLPEFDLDGKLRILDGNDDDVYVVDMGAYEYGTFILNAGPVAIITPPDFVWSGFAHIPRAIVVNFGNFPVSFDASCEFDSAGVIIYSDVVTVTDLADGDSIQVEFAPWSAGASGEFTYLMTVRTLLEGDIHPENDTISKLAHAVKAVADVDIQDYAGNLSANTMELTGVRNSIVVGSYVLVNPDDVEKNVDLYDGPANVDVGLTYSWTDLTPYAGGWGISADNINPDLNEVSALNLGNAAQNVVQVYIPRWTPPKTYLGSVTATGEGEGSVNTDEFTLKVNVVPGWGGWSCSGFGGETGPEGNELYWSNFGFGEQGFNLYRAEPESDEFTRLNASVMKFTTYTDYGVDSNVDYQYKLGLAMGDGKEIMLGPLTLSDIAVEEGIVLKQNFPNPWTDATEISYFLPANVTSATLKVYDVSGMLVKTLASRAHQAGLYSVTWDGTDEKGLSVANGVYFYQLSADDYAQTKKMLLVR